MCNGQGRLWGVLHRNMQTRRSKDKGRSKMGYRGLLAALAIGFCAAAAQAQAASWDFTYTDAANDINVSGVITTGSSVALNPTQYANVLNFSQASQSITGGGGQGTFSGGITAAGYLITGISGTRNGQAISGPYGTPGVITYTPAGNYIFDNLLYVGYAGSVPFVDLGGLEFTTGSGGNTQYF